MPKVICSFITGRRIFTVTAGSGQANTYYIIVLHRYDCLANIPITNMDIISKADNYNRSDII